MKSPLSLRRARIFLSCSLIFVSSGLFASIGMAQINNHQDLFVALTASPSAEYAKTLLNENERHVTRDLWNKLADETDKLYNAAAFVRALELCETVTLVAECLNDSKLRAYSYERMATIHVARQDYELAKANAARSLSIAEESNDYLRIASVCSLIGYISQSVGDYRLAVSYLRRSLDACKEAVKQPDVGDDIKIVSINALLDLGFIFRTQGNYSEAFSHFKQALEISKQKGSREFQLRRAISLRNIATVFADQGDYKKALAYLSEAIEIAKDGHDLVGLGLAYQIMGFIYLQLDNVADARICFKKLEAVAASTQLENLRFESLTSNGSLLQREGKYDLALALYQESLSKTKELHRQIIARLHIASLYYHKGEYLRAIDESDLVASEAGRSSLPELSYQARTIKGKSLLGLKRYEAAQEVFLETISTIETLRKQVTGGAKDHEYFFERRMAPYQGMIKLLVQQNQPAQALNYAERIKGRVLLDVMRHGRIDVDQSIDEKERLEEQRLNGEVVSLNSELRTERARQSSDSARIKSLEARLDRARAAYESFQTLLYAAHPQLRLKHGDLPSFSLDETSKGLVDANSAVLEYVITEDVTYLFVLSKERVTDAEAIIVRVFPINVSSKVLAERVAHFRGRVLKRLPDFAVVGRDLYNLLIMPAEATLKGKAAVCIVPDAALWDLPFQALMSGAGRYLIEDHAIYYTPSLQVLKEIKSRANKPSVAPPRRGTLDADGREQLFAMGNPTVEQGTVAVRRPMRDETFGPLPDAETELQTIARIYGQEKCKIYTGSNAREETFKREASRYRMIHLASHAVLDDNDPLYSYILLAPNEDSKEDGLLEARELLEMNLGAEMVVLSACETGGGTIRQGEGLVGMTWALFLSGVPTTLASQWKIPSYATARLMPRFYGNIGHNISKAEAWRRTVLEFIKDPTYRFQPLSWAGFIIIGDGESQIVRP